MKYDRPVWQIMHACADAMPDVFRYEDVRGWFKEHYPEVGEATIRAHLIGLTEGGRAKHVQFAQRSPVFRRVARGEYEPIPLAERGEGPDAAAPSTSKLKMSPAAGGSAQAVRPAEAQIGLEERLPDVILLGSISDRVNVPAPAKEIFRDVSFQLSRLDAERSGSEWFVLSAEHGLVAPHEWMSPDSRTLAEMEPSYRSTWASWVVTRLRSLVGSLEDRLVRVDAPDEFIGPLFADLQEAGAIVSSGGVAPVAARSPSPATDQEVVVPGPSSEPAPQPERTPSTPVARRLSDASYAVPASDVAELPTTPGLYAWFVDPVGARDLNRSLMLPVRPGLIFVGQVGGSSWQSLADPVLNLRDHVERIQLHGRARASTFRMTLATVLRDHLKMSSLEDRRLTEWMLQHLAVAAWSSDNCGELRELEQLVVTDLDPPLNVDHLPASEYRARLSQLRSASA